MKSGLALFLTISVLAAVQLSCTSQGTADVAVYTVTQGDFVDKLTVSGELEAVKSQVISAPSLSWSMGFPKIAKIVDDGQRVEKGDLLVQFDASEVEKAYSDAANELEIASAELTKASVNHSSQLEELEADLKMAEISHKISKLKLEQATFESDIDRKKIELDLEKAEINLEQARQEIENRRKVQFEELSKLELKVQQARIKLAQAQETLNNLSIYAPTPGIAILRESRMTDEKYQVDDQVYPGWPLIGLPDLSVMQAEVEVNEVEISRIEEGQEAVVRLDAFPEKSFSGKVTEIATLARNKRRNSDVKVFDTIILLDDGDDKLMPGMTVNCEIIVNRLPDTLFVPLEALFIKDGEKIVYLRNGTGFEPRKIVTGAESNNYVIIVEGLAEGDQVALVDPTALQKEAEVKKTDSQEELR